MVGPPEMPDGRLEVPSPPNPDRGEGAAGVLANAIPMLGSLGSIVLVATMANPGNGRRQLLVAALFALATVGFVLVQLDRQRQQRVGHMAGPRADYLHRLDRVRRDIREVAAQQRRALTWLHPDVEALPAVVDHGVRVWERTPGDPHFLKVRCGLGSQRLAVELVDPADSDDRGDLATAALRRRLLEVHRQQGDLPTLVDLPATRHVHLAGPGDHGRSLARALLVSAATFHAPEHLRIALLASPDRLGAWEWVKWLPHCRSPDHTAECGPRVMVATTWDDVEPLLPAPVPSGEVPHVVLVCDGVGTPAHSVGGRTAVEVSDAVRSSALSLDGEPIRCRADRCSTVVAEAVARRLLSHASALRAGGPGGRGAMGLESGDGPGLIDLLGPGDLGDLAASQAWTGRSAADRLRIPLGVDDSGSRVELDLKEASLHGMGPHGLVIGATGSGKSELLRTLVLALALTHSPEHLNFVLVDFKG
ncbi:FtsK/SpoIIIE domain-containing protein, partial [Nocardioides sp.]|uniref:FtsK/SpoIIIE domain-containing protein n=1 Tax=Nocardioides sp. TaxID=35761 RepID=UPI0035676D04